MDLDKVKLNDKFNTADIFPTASIELLGDELRVVKKIIGLVGSKEILVELKVLADDFNPKNMKIEVS